MLKILYTSNFKQLPIACLIAVVCIILIEYYGYSRFGDKYFSHEVDQVLHRIEKQQFNADYLLLGDSVGLQLLRQFSKNSQFACLATNQAIETTGQLFITQRYFENNSIPKYVIFSSLPFIGNKNLNQKYTENFVLRNFTQFNEIWSVFKVKLDPAMFVKMVSYKFLQTFKYRLKLQDSIAGFTNSNIYSGVDSAAKKSKLGEHSILRIWKEKLPKEKTSYVHFVKLIEFLDRHGVEFYYIPVPIKKSLEGEKSWDYRQHQQLITTQLPSLKDQYSNFYFYSELVEYDKNLFRDHAHYNGEGLPQAEKYIRERVAFILSPREE